MARRAGDAARGLAARGRGAVRGRLRDGDEHAGARRGRARARRHPRRTLAWQVLRRHDDWVAREFEGDTTLLVLDQPTRGLDVGSIEFIHRRIIEKRNAGTAVLLVSAELDEVMELSDRIAVLYRGKLVAFRDGRTADKNEVGLLMATGGRPVQADASGAAS